MDLLTRLLHRLCRPLAAGALPVWLAVAGCTSTLPSQRLQSDVNFPIPTSAFQLPSPDRLRSTDSGERMSLTPRSLIRIAFDRQPDIKSSFHRYKSEEARYDFFYATNDSFTPRMLISNDFREDRFDETVERKRDHTVEFSVEKQFFDTTDVNIGVGYATDEFENDIGNAPFLSANLRYPFQASREKLERTSEDIFRQNELNDVQLDYIQTVRNRLQGVLFRFHETVDLIHRVQYYKEWVADLEDIERQMKTIQGRDLTEDRQRLRSEITRVKADRRNAGGKRDLEMTRLKSGIGMPFYIELELLDEPFNPFEGKTHAELLALSIDTDPEIATLRNSMRNSEVQLDLARRGTWDIALLLGGGSHLEGRGSSEGDSDWHVTVGLDVSAVDPRVTGSLSRQAQANIARFQQAIAARENAIFADVFEPLIRIETLGESREELIAGLHTFQSDYEAGLRQYVKGSFSIDDLLQRRANLFGQQAEIARLTFLVGANVAELCSATGKFFELIAGYGNEDPPDAGNDDPPPEKS